MILITGKNGQLAQELKLLVNEMYGLFVDREQFDITNFNQMDSFLLKNKIEFIINCAAYTAVDLAETEQENAFLVNDKAVEDLAVLAKKYGIKLIHISTDYVYEGRTHIPLNENSPLGPVSVYGKSKLAGEEKMLRHNPDGLIIRTSWLYSKFGKNFVATILRLAGEKSELNVVNDQIGTPTNAQDLAEVILVMIKNFNHQGTRIFNFSNQGEVSWYEFAKKIVEIKALNCKINPIGTDQYPTPAKRPSYSVLDKTKIQQHYSLQIMNWDESLNKFFHTHL